MKDNLARTSHHSARSDRRRSDRYDTRLPIKISLQPGGEPLSGFGLEMGPNGMRVLTDLPLIEASFVHVLFESASNNTQCEGRVVWTRHSDDKKQYESGIDIQRWSGDNDFTPEHIPELPNTQIKKDRRRPRS